MVKNKPEISYDRQYDRIYFHSGEKTLDTVQRGNFIVELSRADKVVGLEIESASETLSSLLGEEFTKEDLTNILGAELKVKRQGNVAFIILFITLEKGGKEVREAIPVNLPSGTMATV